MADRIEQNLELLAVVETIDNGTYVGALDSYACDDNNDESDDKEDDERKMYMHMYAKGNLSERREQRICLSASTTLGRYATLL